MLDLNNKDRELAEKVLAAESIPALTDDPVHDALVSAYFRADSTRNALVLSLSQLPAVDDCAQSVDRNTVGTRARITGTEELRQVLKRLILHCRGKPVLCPCH
jgi:hypothetical protein